ncbi:protein of unknown function [Burkholderia multivorans]
MLFCLVHDRRRRCGRHRQNADRSRRSDDVPLLAVGSLREPCTDQCHERALHHERLCRPARVSQFGVPLFLRERPRRAAADDAGPYPSDAQQPPHRIARAIGSGIDRRDRIHRHARRSGADALFLAHQRRHALHHRADGAFLRGGLPVLQAPAFQRGKRIARGRVPGRVGSRACHRAGSRHRELPAADGSRRDAVVFADRAVAHLRHRGRRRGAKAEAPRSGLLRASRKLASLIRTLRNARLTRHPTVSRTEHPGLSINADDAWFVEKGAAITRHILTERFAKHYLATT